MHSDSDRDFRHAPVGRGWLGVGRRLGSAGSDAPLTPRYGTGDDVDTSDLDLAPIEDAQALETYLDRFPDAGSQDGFPDAGLQDRFADAGGDGLSIDAATLASLGNSCPFVIDVEDLETIDDDDHAEYYLDQINRVTAKLQSWISQAAFWMTKVPDHDYTQLLRDGLDKFSSDLGVAVSSIDAKQPKDALTLAFAINRKEDLLPTWTKLKLMLQVMESKLRDLADDDADDDADDHAEPEQTRASSSTRRCSHPGSSRAMKRHRST